MPAATLGEHFLDFIRGDSYPCVGAKTAVARGTVETREFSALGDEGNDRPLLEGLSRFVTTIEANTTDDEIVNSYVALFDGPFDMDELQFESAMWDQLWRLHQLDVLAGNPLADDVSHDTESPQFSLSIAGHPFFVIGLHAQSSRLARRFDHPALVFNSHRQFKKLKANGLFERMQTATRGRDMELQGSLNPNLADFGEASEARQYSGRKVEDDWKCPYDFRKTT